MFKMTQSEAYFWPVKVEIPVSGGRFETQTFDAEFKRVSNSRFKEILEEIKEDKITDVSLVKEVLNNWRGIEDQGQEMPFSQASLAALLDIPGVASAIAQSFFESRSGAKRKN